MSTARWWPVVAVASLGLVGWAVAQSPGAAQVILARAPAEAVTAGQPAGRALQKGERLSPGDRVRTGRGGAPSTDRHKASRRDLIGAEALRLKFWCV